MQSALASTCQLWTTNADSRDVVTTAEDLAFLKSMKGSSLSAFDQSLSKIISKCCSLTVTESSTAMVPVTTLKMTPMQLAAFTQWNIMVIYPWFLYPMQLQFAHDAG
jgi:hypothetical protein